MIPITLLLITTGVFLAQYRRLMKKMEEKTLELNRMKSYESALEGLIGDVRAKQHDFDNHITAIHNQHMVYKTYDELVAAQQGYCKDVIASNRFNKLLFGGNSVLIGFLYGKFKEIEEKGVEIKYEIATNQMACNVPIYKVVEMVGILLDNAAEEVLTNGGGRRIWVIIKEFDDYVNISVINLTDGIKHTDIERYFEKGYSRKKEGRGIGLAKVRDVCKAYGCDLVFSIVEINGGDAIKFKICIKK